MKRFSAEGILLLITLIWGVTFVIIKSALQDISPMLFISFRFTLSALILSPFIKNLFNPGAKQIIKDGIFLGFLYFASFATQTAGLKFTSATKSGFITGTFIIFIPLFQFLIEKRIPGKGNFIGIFLAFTGLIFLSAKGTSFFEVFNEMGSGFNEGDFLTIICAIFVALYIIYLDKISKKHDYKSLAFLQIGTTSVCSISAFIIFSLTGLEETKLQLNENVVSALLYTSILATVFATFYQTKYQKKVTPAKAGIIFSFEPIFSALFAFFILNEKISNFGLLGCFLIFSGLIATEVIVQRTLPKGIPSELRRYK